MDHAPKHRLAELPRRSVRSLDPDVIARIFDGTPHLEPEVVRRQRGLTELPRRLACHLDPTPREGGWLIAGALGALMWVGVYELIRWWLG
jgi:hypothetical protein